MRNPGQIAALLIGALTLCVPRAQADSETLDEIVVTAGRFLRVRGKPVEDRLDAVQRRKNERDRFGGDRHAVAELPHQALGGMRQGLEAG